MMRIIFVRHGHPDYEKNCLTEIGHKQAEAAAQRLSGETVEAIYSSHYGRALETAAHIAARHHLPVRQLDFMYELHWGSADSTPIHKDGNPWFLAHEMVCENCSLFDPGWQEREGFRESILHEHIQRVTEGIDTFLAGLGYAREGHYYRVTEEKDHTYILVSHAGSSGAVLGHLLNLPFPFVCSTMSPDFTGISIINFRGKTGQLITPRVELLSDARHIDGLRVEMEYKQ